MASAAQMHMRNPLMHYMVVYASSLLENLTKDFLGLTIPSDVSVMCPIRFNALGLNCLHLRSKEVFKSL